MFKPQQRQESKSPLLIHLLCHSTIEIKVVTVLTRHSYWDFEAVPFIVSVCYHREKEYDYRLHFLFFRFDTGWVVKIGRGLDIYKAAESKFSIGFCDFDLRPCHQTTIDIFNRKYMKDSVDTAEDTV